MSRGRDVRPGILHRPVPGGCLGCLLVPVAGVVGLVVLAALLTPAGSGSGSGSAPAPAPIVAAPPAPDGPAFLAARLAELDAFRGDPGFHEVYGFGAGGPYHAWLAAVQARRDAPGLARAEEGALAQLVWLGHEYRTNGGRDDELTLLARAQLTRAIGAAAP